MRTWLLRVLARIRILPRLILPGLLILARLLRILLTVLRVLAVLLWLLWLLWLLPVLLRLPIRRRVVTGRSTVGLLCRRGVLARLLLPVLLVLLRVVGRRLPTRCLSCRGLCGRGLSRWGLCGRGLSGGTGR